jgi:hypothetical protein
MRATAFLAPYAILHAVIDHARRRELHPEGDGKTATHTALHEFLTTKCKNGRAVISRQGPPPG